MSNADTLLHALRTWGRQPAGELVARLAISRATLMRAVQALGPQVVSLGQARRTAYAARRPVRTLGDPLPLYRIDESGQPHEVALLAPLHPAGCAMLWREACPWPLEPEMAEGWFDGLPYLLDDARPQGFLGRHFARRHAALLQVAPDPTQWSDDDVLHVLSLLGTDLPGCHVLGEPALRAWLERSQQQLAVITDDAWPDAYERHVAAALSDGDPGSSAGGEFPKFMALRERAGVRRHVLVKFSGADGSPTSQRWSDLLVCEHLASRVLTQRLGIPAATNQLLQAGGRTYLEVDRFDRHGVHGRSPVCTWAALNAGLFGLSSPSWLSGVQALTARGWLPVQTQEVIARVWQFGRLIGNTDMHDGNLAFRPGLQLAPIYDMLPMRYAPPRAAEVITPAFVPPLPLPAEREAWHGALPAAQAFWALAAGDERISDDFRRVCANNASLLEPLAARA
ncbi:MAG: type II toxin-antitoxin system HipA family toxin YjjJ [Ramlibacter sp.]